MNIYTLLISNWFLKSHSRWGEETGFIQKIIDQRKIHTVRLNYKYWKKRIDKIQAREGILSIRSWSGKPYNSKQTTYIQLPYAGIERIDIVERKIYIEGKAITDARSIQLAFNDGFEFSFKGLKDFFEWIGADREDIRDGCIIHFTKFKYAE